MQVLLFKTKKDKKTDNNVIYKSKKINASAYIHHDSRLVEIIKNPCPFRKERLLCALVFKLNIFVTILIDNKCNRRVHEPLRYISSISVFCSFQQNEVGEIHSTLYLAANSSALF